MIIKHDIQWDITFLSYLYLRAGSGNMRWGERRMGNVMQANVLGRQPGTSRFMVGAITPAMSFMRQMFKVKGRFKKKNW